LNTIPSRGSAALPDKTQGLLSPVLKMAEKSKRSKKSKKSKVSSISVKFNDMSLCRAYVEGGNREFCEHETTLLENFVKQITSEGGKIFIPGSWVDYRPARSHKDPHAAMVARSLQDPRIAIIAQSFKNQWVDYLKSQQTLAQAAERIRSLKKFKKLKDYQAWAALNAAKQEFNKRLVTDLKMNQYVGRNRYRNKFLKDFDYSNAPTPRELARGRRLAPMRPDLKGRISQKKTTQKRLVSTKTTKETAAQRIIGRGIGGISTIANTLKLLHIPTIAANDISVSSCFVVTYCNPQPAVGMLRKDPKLGKYTVRPGKESPLRQSVSRV
jgi:hypothetical protein